MENFYLDINSDNVGGYLSSEQIDLLSIIQCSSSSELVKFISNCDQINTLYSQEELESFKSEDLESLKRNVFKDYQDTMVLHDAGNMVALDSSLKHIGIREEDFPEIKSAVASRDMQGLRKLIEERYPERADRILQLNHHFVSTERDLLKDEGLYDELVLLNSQLDSFDSLLIASGKIYNVVNGIYGTEETEKRFDFYKAIRDLEFAKRNGKQVRFHSLLVKDDASKLFVGKKPEEITQILSDYVVATLQFVKEYNENNKVVVDGKKVPVINEIDLFNELVSFERNADGKYYNVWEGDYGVSFDKILDVYEIAMSEKPEGVRYVYNEPFLEDADRRSAVFDTLGKIEKRFPGLIDTLGSQMHITIGEPFGRISACFADFKKFQDETGKNIQITEFDMSLGKREYPRVFGQNAEFTLQQAYDKKRERIAEISNIIKASGVKLSGISYWSLTDGTDCNLERLRSEALRRGQTMDDAKIMIPTAMGGLIPTHQHLIKSMQVSSGNETLKKNSTDVGSNLQVESKDVASTQIQPTAATIGEKKGFDRRSDTETVISQQIRTKNTVIHQQKEKQVTLEKPKVKTLTKPASSGAVSGFVNTLILSLLAGFITGAIFMLAYFAFK